MDNYMLKKKNAQGLSITTIIIVIIGLIVLVVLILLFTGKLGDFSSGVNSLGDPAKYCAGNAPGGQGGKVVPITTSVTDCTAPTVKIIARDTLPGSNKICCK